MVNTKGEFFDAEYDRNLPLFLGPKGRERDMAERFQSSNERLLEKNWTLQELRLSERDSWRLKLGNQWQVEMGREAFEERFSRFLRLATRVSSDQGGRGNYFDMRYPNGFAVATVTPVAVIAAVDNAQAVTAVSAAAQGVQFGN
jgi:cell division protein FtsQ